MYTPCRLDYSATKFTAIRRAAAQGTSRFQEHFLAFQQQEKTKPPWNSFHATCVTGWASVLRAPHHRSASSAAPLLCPTASYHEAWNILPLALVAPAGWGPLGSEPWPYGSKIGWQRAEGHFTASPLRGWNSSLEINRQCHRKQSIFSLSAYGEKLFSVNLGSREMKMREEKSNLFLFYQAISPYAALKFQAK